MSSTQSNDKADSHSDEILELSPFSKHLSQTVHKLTHANHDIFLAIQQHHDQLDGSVNDLAEHFIQHGELLHELQQLVASLAIRTENIELHLGKTSQELQHYHHGPLGTAPRN